MCHLFGLGGGETGFAEVGAGDGFGFAVSCVIVLVPCGSLIHRFGPGGGAAGDGEDGDGGGAFGCVVVLGFGRWSSA